MGEGAIVHPHLLLFNLSQKLVVLLLQAGLVLLPLQPQVGHLVFALGHDRLELGQVGLAFRKQRQDLFATFRQIGQIL